MFYVKKHINSNFVAPNSKFLLYDISRVSRGGEPPIGGSGCNPR